MNLSLRGGVSALVSLGQRGALVAILVIAFFQAADQAFGQSKDDGSGAISILTVPDGWQPNDNVRYAFVPNDPYYTTGNPVGFPGQWHLNKQTSTATVDANLVPAWNRNLTGQGVIIGIVDDGLQRLHPDLAPNYIAADSENLGDGIGGITDPSPVFGNTNATSSDGDNHGTSVAGVAAGRGGNGIGGTGAAPLASLAGLRIDFANQTTQMFVDGTLYHSSGANTSIKVKNHSYGISVPYILSNAEANAAVTSSNAGTIHVFAAGNERSSHGAVIDVNNNGIFDPDIDYPIDADANKKHLQSLQETIDVAALASSGIFSSYSNWGSNIWVTAPSNSFRAGELAITTTDRTGGAVATGGYNNSAGGGDGDAFPDLDYNSIFGGTSSATPLVSGIMALGKQARPNMDVRMAKHLLARTSKVVDAADVDVHSNCLVLPACPAGWQTNGAGLKFNENYGFGLIDADAFTALAANTLSVTPLVTQTVGTTNVGQAIPDNNTTGVSRNFVLLAGAPLEEVELTLNITHPWRGDLEAFVRSPAGTLSRLIYRNGADSFNNINWTFLTNAFWGENPLGTWTVTVRDVFAADVGTWNSFSVLAKMGTIVAIPEPAAATLASLGIMALLFRRSRVSRPLSA